MTTDVKPAIDIRLAADRFHTNIGWLDSWHSFSFANHYDPSNTGHGLLLVSNDDRVAPGGGFGMHPHRDMEIVTWVLEGRLEHRDSEGNHGVIYPGLAQRMSAGTGILHSEMNPSQDEPVHFLQMWVLPDTQGLVPSYSQVDVSSALDSGEWVAVASGADHATGAKIHQADATLWVARPEQANTLVIPSAPHVHFYVARGSVTLKGQELSAGDAVRLTNATDSAIEVTATDSDVEILAWATA